MKKLICLLYVIMNSFSVSSQNVGISSNISFNPQYTLDVDGIFKVSNYASVGVNPNSAYRFYAYNSSSNYARLGSNQYGVYARGSSSAVWGMNSTIGGHAVRAEQTSTGYAIYADGVTSRNYFQGNVGIGSLSPSSKLEVIGSASGETSSAIYGELDITDAQGIGVVGIGGYNGVQGNVFPIGNQTYYGTSGNVISTSGVGTNIGIYGRAEGGGLNYAGYFLGDVLVTSLGGGGLKGVAADVNGLLRPTNGIGPATILSCGPSGVCEAGTGSVSGSDLTLPEASVTINCLPAGSTISSVSVSVSISGTSCAAWSFLEYYNGSSWVYLGCNGTYNITVFNGGGNGTSIRVRGRDNPLDGISDFITVSITGVSVGYTSPCINETRIQRIIRGTVNADASIAGGGGFTVAKDGNGRYRITFATPFTDIPSASATQIFTGVGSLAATNSGNTRDNAVIYGISASGVNIATGDGNGDRGDRAFSFIVIGSE